MYKIIFFISIIYSLGSLTSSLLTLGNGFIKPAFIAASITSGEFVSKEWLSTPSAKKLTIVPKYFSLPGNTKRIGL